MITATTDPGHVDKYEFIELVKQKTINSRLKKTNKN